MTKTGFFKTVKAFSCAAALAAGLFASAALSSCSNLEGDDFSPATQTAPAGTAPGGESVPASLKMGSVSGTIQQKEEQPTVARSVVPTVADVTGGIISYTVSAWGTKADGTVVPESSPITVDTTTTTFSLGLEYGTWTLRADAKDTSSNIIMTQTAATPITLDDSNPVVNLNFALDYAQISGTPGALSLTMAYATSVSKISYSLLKSNGTPVASGVVNPAPASSFTLNASQDSALGSLEPGDYQLVVEFLATDSSVLMRMDQAVQIYSNITTNKIDGVAPYINSGAVNVSADVIKKYQQSVVYVGGTGIGSGTAASDSNNGTQFDPVEHVERALEIIEASMLTSSDVPDGFKIFVQADTSLTGNLALSSSKKISIVGTNTSAYYKISGALTNGITASASDVSFSYINLNKIHGFDITGGQTTLKNCSITNGKARVDSTMIYASSGGGGGGICVKRSAKAILTDCSISGCSAESGGAVYVRDDSESGLAEVELTRCVLGDALRTSCASESDCSNKATGGGGGIYINKFGKATLNNTKIIGNVAVDGCGGAIYCNAATLAISGGQINYNHSKQSGGGIYVGGWDVAPGSVAVDGCVIGVTGAAAPATGISDCGNYCETYGSGAGLYIDENATLSTTSGFSVLKNYCGSSGGGFYNKSATATVLPNCDISYNACADNGGGIYNEGTLSLQGGTIAGNAAANNGGGVYLSAGAKLFVSGAAAIGQDLASTSSAATSASGQHSNTAVLGGGIYNAGELYLGYASGSTPSPADWTGSVCYNYASSDGGGVYSDGNSAVLKMNTGNVAYNLCSDGTGSTGGGGGVAARGGSGFEMSGGKVTCNQTNDKVGGGIYIDGGGTLALNGTAEVSSNKTSPDGTGSMGGAGLFAYRASITMEGNAVVKDNLCKACGGGVYLFESENASSYASLAMSGNAKILENTSSDGFGGAVYVTQRCLFSIKEAAAIPAGVGGATGVGKNDVYLDTDTSINVAGSITSTTTPVATITPKTYAPGTAVLVDSGTGTLVKSELAKFAVTPDSGEEWTIGYNATSKTGELSSATIYVSGGSDGSDTTGTGSSAAPYKTVAHALSKVIAPNCSIIIKENTTETLPLTTPAGCPGLTIKSADTAKKTITGTSSINIHFEAAATVSNIAFSNWGCVYVASSVVPVELDNVAITDCSDCGLWLGGGAMVSAQNLTVKDCSVTDASGGGIYVNGGANLSVDGLVMQGCHADSEDCDGGGIANAGTVSLRQAKITGCSASRHGAGIFNANNATLILDSDCDIPSGIYLTGGDDVSATAAKPLYIKGPYFALADGASKIPLEPEIRSGAGNDFQENSAVIKGWEPESGSGAYTVKEAQVKCFALTGTALSLEYDGAAAPPCGKLVDKSIAGGITVNLGGNISFVIATPSAAGEKARFNVLDKSVTPAATIDPTSARIEIKQYGSAIYFADAQEVTAGYLPEGEYELYCKAVVGGVVYDTTVPFGAGGKYTPLTLEAAVAGAVVTFDNKAADVVKYRVNGGAEHEIASGTSEAITLSAVGDRVQFFGDNTYYATHDGSGNYNVENYTASNIACTADCYVYGNIMSLVDSAGFASVMSFASPCALTGLFMGNTHIKNKSGIPLSLPATTLSDGCYTGLFYGCTSLTSAPELPAMTLADRCYYVMFYECTGLATAPALPATTLTESCYEGMFRDCTSLTTAPELPAPTLEEWSYRSMFNGCSSLNNVTCLATYIRNGSHIYTYGWLSGVAATGTFTKAAGIGVDTSGGWTSNSANGIPTGWVVNGGGSSGAVTSATPLTIEATVAGATVTFKNKASGSVTFKQNGGEAQTIASGGSVSIILSAVGDKVEFFGDNTTYGVENSSDNSSRITCTDNCYVYGNFMSLVNSTGYASADSVAANAFAYLFYNNTKIKNKSGYDLLLPATTLASSCYEGMFYGCSGLTKAPDLPATTLAEACYHKMFANCSALTASPELPAPTLVDTCYKLMFYGCSNLTSITCLATNTSATGCTTNWVYNVSSTGTFTKANGMTWPTSSEGIPGSGWTVHDAP